MNFLQLCQETASECSVRLDGYPTTTTGQTGRLGQIVGWVNKAWIDIQTRRQDWLFMVGSASVQTVADDGAYSTSDFGITSFRAWRLRTFKIFLTSAGVGTETELLFIDYNEWFRRFNTGSQTSSYPGFFTVDHDKDILLGPKPNGIYTVSAEYQKAASQLSGDSDIPELPEEFHMAIVYRAMMKYGRYVGDSTVYTDGEKEYKRMITEMIASQTPPIVQGGALA